MERGRRSLDCQSLKQPQICLDPRGRLKVRNAAANDETSDGASSNLKTSNEIPLIPRPR